MNVMKGTARVILALSAHLEVADAIIGEIVGGYLAGSAVIQHAAPHVSGALATCMAHNHCAEHCHHVAKGCCDEGQLDNIGQCADDLGNKFGEGDKFAEGTNAHPTQLGAMKNAFHEIHYGDHRHFSEELNRMVADNPAKMTECTKMNSRVDGVVKVDNIVAKNVDGVDSYTGITGTLDKTIRAHYCTMGLRNIVDEKNGDKPIDCAMRCGLWCNTAEAYVRNTYRWEYKCLSLFDRIAYAEWANKVLGLRNTDQPQRINNAGEWADAETRYAKYLGTKKADADAKAAASASKPAARTRSFMDIVSDTYDGVKTMARGFSMGSEVDPEQFITEVRNFKAGQGHPFPLLWNDEKQQLPDELLEFETGMNKAERDSAGSSTIISKLRRVNFSVPTWVADDGSGTTTSTTTTAGVPGVVTQQFKSNLKFKSVNDNEALRQQLWTGLVFELRNNMGLIGYARQLGVQVRGRLVEKRDEDYENNTKKTAVLVGDFEEKIGSQMYGVRFEVMFPATPKKKDKMTKVEESCRKKDGSETDLDVKIALELNARQKPSGIDSLSNLIGPHHITIMGKAAVQTPKNISEAGYFSHVLRSNSISSTGTAASSSTSVQREYRVYNGLFEIKPETTVSLKKQATQNPGPEVSDRPGGFWQPTTEYVPVTAQDVVNKGDYMLLGLWLDAFYDQLKMEENVVDVANYHVVSGNSSRTSEVRLLYPGARVKSTFASDEYQEWLSSLMSVSVLDKSGGGIQQQMQNAVLPGASTSVGSGLSSHSDLKEWEHLLPEPSLVERLFRAHRIGSEPAKPGFMARRTTSLP